MAGNMDWNPPEYAVSEKDQTSRHTEGVTSPAPSGHSVMQTVNLDSQHSRNKLKPDQSGYPVSDDTTRRKVGFYDNQTVSDLLVDSNTKEGGDPVPKPAPSELAEHSTSVEHSLWPGYPVQGDTPCRKVGFYDNQTVLDLLVDLNTDEGGDPVPRPAPSELAEHSASVEHSLRPLRAESSEYPAGTPRGVVGVSDSQPVSEPTEQLKTGCNLVLKLAPLELAEQPRSGAGFSPGTDTVSRPLLMVLPGIALESRQLEGPPRKDRQETTGSGEAIVVGAIGSAAPWFLTGWAHEVEIEFMIDTGCQVAILSTTMIERMCTVDPAVRSALRPCRRRLVSADSSPLIVQGQLQLNIVFPGLCCDMLFVVANIGSDGLLGTEALQSHLPHQLDLRTGQLWADGWSTLQLHQQRLTPDLDGLLTTLVVIPPDSEIVA